jgi:hypothetical protein
MGDFQAQFNFEKLTYEEEKVWEILRFYRGKDNAVKGAQIAEWTELEYDFVRAIIRHLVNSHDFFIASCAKGYFIPLTPEENETSNKSLRRRGIRILMRAAKQQKNSLEDIFNQARMEFNSIALGAERKES